MWETSHGFPRAERLPSGHRRYAREQVEAVREVARARDAGLSLAAAIERVGEVGDVPEASIFGGLRRRRPELQPYPIPKRLLVAVSHAIEDECSASGERAVLVGSFQRERFYRQAEPRWREFARTSELALALADFKEVGGPPEGPVEVPVERNHPLADEWAIVCDAPGFAACLAGASARPRASGCSRCCGRWSPTCAWTRCCSGSSLPARTWPASTSAFPSACRGRPAANADSVARATSLTNRMLAYVAASS